jgi:hypothetical protein
VDHLGDTLKIVVGEVLAEHLRELRVGNELWHLHLFELRELCLQLLPHAAHGILRQRNQPRPREQLDHSRGDAGGQ